MKTLCEVLLIIFYNYAGVDCLGFKTERTRQFSFEKFDNKCAGQNAPMIFNFTSVRLEGNKLCVNSTIIIKEDILTDPMLLIRLERCKNKENLDTCESFYDYNFNSSCTVFQQPMWASVVKGFKPPYKCPLLKNVYQGTNGTVDLSAIVLFPVEKWYWKVKLDMIDKHTQRTLMCLKLEAYFTMQS